MWFWSFKSWYFSFTLMWFCAEFYNQTDAVWHSKSHFQKWGQSATNSLSEAEQLKSLFILRELNFPLVWRNQWNVFIMRHPIEAFVMILRFSGQADARNFTRAFSPEKVYTHGMLAYPYGRPWTVRFIGFSCYNSSVFHFFYPFKRQGQSLI